MSISCNLLRPPTRHRSHPCFATRRAVTPLEVADCYVYGAEGRVKGICHFIGGAFAGAVPQVIYPVLLRELAENGYTVVATPFAVSFKHQQCAEMLQTRFSDALVTLRSSPIAAKVPEDVPLHGIGHSFGALAHALIGCSQTNSIASNVLISFNNKAVEEAIPIPGFVETARSAFAAYDESPLKLLPEPLPVIKELLKRLLPTVANPTAGLSRRAVDDALDQIDAVLTEIREGVVDFDPAPADSAQRIRERYCVPETLLVQFSNDTIDETETLAELMQSDPKQSATVQRVSGSHVTPCIGDARWLGTLADVDFDETLAEQIQQDVVSDTRSLVAAVLKWLDMQLDEAQ